MVVLELVTGGLAFGSNADEPNLVTAMERRADVAGGIHVEGGVAGTGARRDLGA